MPHLSIRGASATRHYISDSRSTVLKFRMDFSYGADSSAARGFESDVAISVAKATIK